MTRDPIPLYVDCDTGIDDALALAYLVASPEVRIVGAGSVSGNVDAATGARNTLDLLALAGAAEIPVAVGAMHPLVGRFDGGAPDVHGPDGLGGVRLPASAAEPVQGDAVDLLLGLADEHGGRLQVLAIGPLTNLALALERDPALPGRVERMTVMGGAVRVPGNVNAAAEANILSDPEAAALVFAAAWPVTLVPLDLTQPQRADAATIEALGASGTPLAEALAQMLRFYGDFYRRANGFDGPVLHDPLAAALVTGGAVAAASAEGVVSVVTDDSPERGRTVLHDPLAEGPLARVVLGLAEPLAPHLFDRLARGRGAPPA